YSPRARHPSVACRRCDHRSRFTGWQRLCSRRQLLADSTSAQAQITITQGNPMTHLLIALLAASVVAAGCAAQTRSPNRTANALHTQLDEDWKYWMTQYPETATAFGYPGQNMRWTDYS